MVCGLWVMVHGSWFMVFNTTFTNISVISWWSFVLDVETKVPRENHRPVASHCQTLTHNVISRVKKNRLSYNLVL